MNKKFKLTAKPGASIRTRNRIREHGPLFLILDKNKNVGFYTNANEMILIQSTVHENYIGWFPDNELEIEESE